MDFSHISAQLSSSPLTALPILFIAGVLTSLAPCIYPMIPITAAIVGGSAVGDAPRARSRTVFLTFAYVLGLALAYASVGLFAGLTGTLFGSVSTNPWLYFAMANLLIIAALAMLDVIPVRVPTWLLTRASTAGKGGKPLRRVRHGSGFRTRRRAVLGAGDGRGSDLGDRDQERSSRIHLPVRVLARHVHAAGAGRTFQRHARPPAESGTLDGMDQAAVRADHVGRCGVLPCADGAAPHLSDSQHRNHNQSMMTIRKPFMSSQISLLALLATATLTSTPAFAQDLGIEVGAQAPVVTVQSLDGKQIDLGQYIGKTPMLIEFWATWCPNCRELMPTLLDAEKKFGKRVKFVALAVAINQSPEKVRRWLAAHPLPHDTFYDVDRESGRRIRCSRYFIRRRARQNGTSGLHRSWRKAEPGGRAE